MTSDEQLKLWVDGTSRCPNDNGDCCPDFSCCQPVKPTPKETRLRFAQAIEEGDDKTKMSMLGMFLGGLAQAATDKKCVVEAGEEPGGVH